MKSKARNATRPDEVASLHKRPTGPERRRDWLTERNDYAGRKWPESQSFNQ